MLNVKNLETLLEKFPGRNDQIVSLFEYFGYNTEPFPDVLFIYGQPAVGKTSVLKNVLDFLKVKHVFVNCVECYSKKLLFKIIGHGLFSVNLKCENFMDLIFYLKLKIKQNSDRLVIVFDGMEYLQELGSHFISAFASLQTILGSRDVCVIFISHILPEKFNTDGSYLTLHFPQYSKDELMGILKFTKPEYCSDDLYNNYLNAALSTFWRTTRDLNEMKFLITGNFQFYYEPISQGLCNSDNVSALWKNIMPYFKTSLNNVYSGLNTQNIERLQYNSEKNEMVCVKGQSVLDLPYYAKFFLIAAFLASYNLPKHDRRLFMKNHGKQRKRKITNKLIKEKKALELLGPKPFPLDRLMAIFFAIMEEKASLTVNLVTEISTLVELKLLARIGDLSLDRPKFKCLVGLETIEAVSRTLGFNVKKYILD